MGIIQAQQKGKHHISLCSALTGGLWGNSQTKQPRVSEGSVWFAKQMAAFVEFLTFQIETAAQMSAMEFKVWKTPGSVVAIQDVRTSRRPSNNNIYIFLILVPAGVIILEFFLTIYQKI